MSMTKTPKKVQELLDQLAKDGIVPVGKVPKEEWDTYVEKLRRDEEPLVKALGKAGTRVNSVWDLVNTSEPYPKALPVLIEHLTGDYHPKILAGIARALAVRDPYAMEHAWPVALDLFLKTDDENNKEPEMRGFKEGLAVTLSVICTEDRLPQMFDLIRDSRHGDNRTHLIYGLRRFCKNQKVKEFLESLCTDPYWRTLAQETLHGRRRR